jgi:hypothetical protein
VKTWQVIGILVLGFAAVPAYGQTSQPAPAQQPAQKQPQKAKKVWTNEDLAELPANAPVSTATAAPAPGEEKAAEGGEKAPAKAGELPPEKDPKTYQKKLEDLRKRLADVDAKIKATQDATSGAVDGSNAVNLNQPTPILRPADQLAAFEKERQDIQQQIDDLESEARRNGIPPGDIRSNP